MDHKKSDLPRLARLGARGFTLIEVLVAVIVLTVCLVVVMELFSGGLRSGRVSEGYVHAIYHAREKMEDILTDPELAPGSDSGEFADGSSWKVEITAIEEEKDRPFPGKAYGLFQIDLKVSWRDGSRQRHFSLSTIQIARRQSPEEA